MGSGDCTAPKLSLLISRPTNPPEMATPPLHAAVSVPFQWEEAPGKPRNHPTESKPKTARTLDLPPRLLFSEAKVSNVPLPTTFLDRPYMGRTMSFTSSNRSASKDYWNGNFGSSRWRSFKRNGGEEEEEEQEGAGEGSFDFSKGSTRVRTWRAGIRRRGSFLGNIYNSRSHPWASIRDSLKRVVPWRRRREGHTK